MGIVLDRLFGPGAAPLVEVESQGACSSQCCEEVVSESSDSPKTHPSRHAASFANTTARYRNAMRLWELCSGTGSVEHPWRAAGHEVMSLDSDPKCGADVCQDLLSWEYTYFGLEAPDQSCLDIIAYWRPRYWFLENPQTGLLKTRDVVQGIPYVDLDYCMYGAPYRKRTRIWTNTAWTPRRLCNHASHPMTAQKGPSRRGGCLIQDDNCSLQTLHGLPAALTEELLLYCTNEEAG